MPWGARSATTTLVASTSLAGAAVKPVKARCAANQRLVDILLARRSKIGTSNNYTHTLRKATDSLAKQREPVNSYEEAKALPGIGDHVAHLLFPLQAATPPSPASSTASSVKANVNAKPKATKRKANAKRTTNKNNDNISAMAAIPEEIAEQTEDLLYAKKLQQQRLFPTLRWRVVLLIDLRERQANHMIAKCKMSGIPCEERPLPIGDMAWIAQGLEATSESHKNSKKKKKKEPAIVTELLIGTIIERKTTEDLKASLFGTRYNEQQLRLKHSGLPQVLFLIEGDLSKDQHGCPAETLHTALYDIRIHKGFSIVHTLHMTETVVTLKRMHRRILQRTFPTAFGDQALPDFSEAAARRRQQSPHAAAALRRQQGRRRLSSLMEMTFDTPPVNIRAKGNHGEGRDNWITYAELQAKVQTDRAVGTRTTGSIHAAMLKQVASISNRKIQALTRVYPTANRLLSTYAQLNNNNNDNSNTTTDKDNDARQQLVQDMVLDAQHGTGKIGPNSSQELFVAYQTGGTGRKPRTIAGSSTESAVKNVGPSDTKREPAPATAALPPAKSSSATDSPFWNDDDDVFNNNNDLDDDDNDENDYNDVVDGSVGMARTAANSTPLATTAASIKHSSYSSTKYSLTNNHSSYSSPQSILSSTPPKKKKPMHPTGSSSSARRSGSCIDLLSSSSSEDELLRKMNYSYSPKHKIHATKHNVVDDDDRKPMAKRKSPPASRWNTGFSSSSDDDDDDLGRKPPKRPNGGALLSQLSSDDDDDCFLENSSPSFKTSSFTKKPKSSPQVFVID